MKWQAIANVTSTINEEARGYLLRKLEKDASVELPHLWTDFIGETSKHLYDSQSNIEVSPSGKTGGFACVTNFDESHPDRLDSGKQFINYALDKFDQRAAGYLANAKNPITKRIMQSKIGDYRVHLANQINDTEIKLIDGKRHVMAVESIEKSKNAVYNNPELYNSFIGDCFNAINSSSSSPQEKEHLTRQAQAELAGAAASSILKRSPETIINHSRLLPEAQQSWWQHLNLDQRIRLENQANNMLQQKQAIKQQQVKSMLPSHYASILKTGQGVTVLDNLLKSSFAPNDPTLLKIKQDEKLYKQASAIVEQLKNAPFSESGKILAQIAPKGGELDYADRERMSHILIQNHREQLDTVQNDPAKYVEELYSEEIDQNLSLSERCPIRKQLQTQKGIPEHAQRCLTNDETKEFVRRIEGNGDINTIKNTIDSIIGLKDENGNQYGLTLMEEILGGNGKSKFSGKNTDLFVRLYTENKLFGHSIADVFLLMINKNNLFSKPESDEFDKVIENNNTITEFGSNIKRQDTQNNEEVDYRKQEVKYLALYYKQTQQLTTEKAIDKAVDIVIKQRYMSVTKDSLHIPRQLIAGNMIHNLHEDYIEGNLADLHRGIIDGNINYDLNSNFGANWQDGKDIVDEALRQGKWKITPDGKSVYFSYLTAEGVYRPLMEKEGKILIFNLLDLNNPQGMEKQKRELEQMHSDIYNKFDSAM